MKKKLTKADVIKEKLELLQEDMFRMELVRDYNLSKKEQVEADAAVKRIDDITAQMTWLKAHLESLE
jgi:hypothetical protein